MEEPIIGRRFFRLDDQQVLSDAMLRSGPGLRHLPQALRVHGDATIGAGTPLYGVGLMVASAPELAQAVHVEAWYRLVDERRRKTAEWLRVTCDAADWSDCWRPR